IFAPIYLRNLRFQSFVAALPQRVAKETAAGAPPSDDLLRTWVLDKAHRLDLPVTAGDVQIHRSPGVGLVERIEVKYLVRVDFPGYTVNLHFYPGAGSK
ncbi:MAG: hypothetical protein LAQ30_15640, partial [Acidobacteriia bacterium]|nr:hypothetical protein [Terriglobia bacterium]